MMGVRTIGGCGSGGARGEAPLQANQIIVGYMQRHDRRCHGREPAARRGPGHSVADGHVDALGLADQFPEAMIVTALAADG